MMNEKMNDRQLEKYSRHILLDDIGVEGQEQLLNSRALIVGAGGLGCPAALYLAAAGVGEITICDNDTVDLTNLQRQILHREKSIGELKVESAKRSLLEINPQIKIAAVAERITEKNARMRVAAADVVIDGSDNFASRHLINRACIAEKKPLIFGAAGGFDGQVTAFDFRRSDSPCYGCLFAESANAEETRCALMGVLAPLAGAIGCLQAAEAIKILAIPNAATLAGRLLILDARDMRIREVRLARDPSCETCGKR